MIGDFISKLNVSTIIYFINNFIRNQEIDWRIEAHNSKYPTITLRTFGYLQGTISQLLHSGCIEYRIIPTIFLIG